MRGTALRGVGVQVGVGITPACAGNSWTGTTKGTAITDHPRVCGEQFGAVADMPRARGSPPRVRGTVEATGSLTEETRITPACAGNRSLHLWAKR